MQRCIDLWNCTRADRCAMVLRSVDWTGADRCAMVHRSVGLNRGRSMRFGAKICVAEQGQIDVQWCIDLWGWTGADRCAMVHIYLYLNWTGADLSGRVGFYDLSRHHVPWIGTDSVSFPEENSRCWFSCTSLCVSWAMTSSTAPTPCVCFLSWLWIVTISPAPSIWS